jgi:DNA-binding NarL/FixJ family response regulator
MSTIADIKIVMADDHEIFRDGFKLMLSKQKDIMLLADAENGQELLELVEREQPDVVITDIKMPILDGIEATQKITERYPNIGVIGLSMFDEDDLIIDMLEAGAKGYLLKNSNKEQIIEAIKTVYGGDPYYCKTTSHKLTRMIASSKYNPHKRTDKVELSDREKEILQLICQEQTNKEIADQLFISVRTVEGHRQKILEKLNVKNSIGLVVYAMRNGLFPDK